MQKIERNQLANVNVAGGCCKSSSQSCKSSDNCCNSSSHSCSTTTTTATAVPR